eukprot:GFYU01000443.1.p1 GENE.GFYU01000443.1~~GFYU01000443.1.p1  ORF type:complete len:519 (+),score=102.05 GFYU01000443.1:93-1649(+)
MSRAAVLVVTFTVIVTLEFAPTTFAQTLQCTEYRAQGSVCNPFFAEGYMVGPTVYDKNTTWFLEHEAKMKPFPLLIRGLQKKCRDRASEYLCKLNFWTCTPNGNVPPCQEMCETFAHECREQFTLAGVGYILTDNPCSALPPQSSGKCMRAENKQVSIPWTCPDPLLKSPDDLDWWSCQLPCMGVYYSDAEWDIATYFQMVLSALSTLGSGVMAVTFFLFEERRKFPSNLLGHFALNCTILNLTMFIITFKQRSLFCTEGGFVADSINGQNWNCTLQGAVFLYTVSACCSFWLCIAIQLYLTAVRVWRLPMTFPLNKYYLAFGYGYPLITTVVPLIARKIQYQTPMPWCFVGENENSTWTYVVFYGPAAGMLIVGGYMVLHVMYLLHKINAPDMAAKRRSQLRTAWFVVMVFLSFTWAVSYRIGLSMARDRIKRGTIDWIACITLDKENCTLEGGPRYFGLLGMIIFICLCGVEIFLVQCATKQNLALWLGKLGLLSEKERELMLRGSSSQGGSIMAT